MHLNEPEAADALETVKVQTLQGVRLLESVRIDVSTRTVIHFSTLHQPRPFIPSPKK